MASRPPPLEPNVNRNDIAGVRTASAAARRHINPSDIAEVVGGYAHADAVRTEAEIDAAHAALPGWARGSIRTHTDAHDRIGAVPEPVKAF